jgi:hypothetical protein
MSARRAALAAVVSFAAAAPGVIATPVAAQAAPDRTARVQRAELALLRGDRATAEREGATIAAEYGRGSDGWSARDRIAANLGTELLEKIITEAPKHLKFQGQLWLEHEPEQAEIILKLAENDFITTTHKDQYQVLRFSQLVLK